MTEPATPEPSSPESTTSESSSPSATSASGRRLQRGADGRPAAPVRIVHLGVGNFFRAHQAWYTAHADDAEQWGVAAFTGRSPKVARELEPQQGLYTLVTAAPEGNRYEVVDALSAVHPADDLAALLELFADPGVSVVTSTVTEAGHHVDRNGQLDDTDPAVQADLAALAAGDGELVTAPGRIVAGLRHRRERLGERAPISFVPCDNLSGNGDLLRRVVLDLAGRVDPSLVGWIEDNAAFVTTMVDRITPSTTDEDRAAVLAATGVDDPAAVVTEPFSEWVLAGEFAAGRPDWASSGATFTEDIEPYETRKLRLLNGSHSLMAYAAPLLGHELVSEAIADERVRAWVEQWWDEACAHLTLPQEDLVAYRQALLDRYANPQIKHQLAQIAADGSQKLPIRITPVVLAELAAGHVPSGALRALAAWTLHLRGLGAPVSDPGAERVRERTHGSLDEAVAAVLAHVGVADPRAQAATVELAAQLEELAGR